MATKKPRHDERESSGRYKKSEPCDCCGMPVGTQYGTDDEVCGGGDGPGFRLCSRVRCGKKTEGLAPWQRAEIYLKTCAPLWGEDLEDLRARLVGWGYTAYAGDPLKQLEPCPGRFDDPGEGGPLEICDHCQAQNEGRHVSVAGTLYCPACAPED